MGEHHFISYSHIDGQDFAVQLDEALRTRARHRTFFDQTDAGLGRPWRRSLGEAIKTCASVLFVISRDSTAEQSVCLEEFELASRFAKPIVLLRIHCDTEPLIGFAGRKELDFTGDFERPFEELCRHLDWLLSPAGLLRRLEVRRHALCRNLKRPGEDGQCLCR